uniref:Uncharacterized protein LOC101242726 n=1 Tax=Phallusia mammillata TaxID=59560 RepID=A0A6F9DI52_9ASCI|nr:uncharacterized protein LOC101242726 [Phallusia mammillata]
MAGANTSANFTEPSYSSAVWISLQTFVCLFTFCQAYILVCLLLYEQRHTPSGNTSPSNSQSADASTNVAQKYKKQPTSKIWLRRFTILACINALIKSATNEIDLFLGSKSVKGCLAFAYLTVCAYGGSLFFITMFLWLRQATVQSHRSLRSLPGTKIRIRFGRFLLILLILVFIALFILSFVTMRVKPSTHGCIFADIGMVSQSARSTAGLAFTLFFQPAFAILLLYPFLKKLPKSSSQNPTMTCQPKIMNVIKRSLITLLVIIITDIGTIVASFLLVTKPCVWLSVVYDANSLIGVLSVIIAYPNWRVRLALNRARFKRKPDSNRMRELSTA